MISAQFVPVLERLRALYALPRGRERFDGYLALVRSGDGTMALPLANINPMAKEHALAVLDALEAIDAENVAAEAMREAASELSAFDDSVRVMLVILDDIAGGWTHRGSTDFSHRFERKHEVMQGWATAELWCSETPTAQRVGERVRASMLRTLEQRRDGAVVTLRAMLDREGRALRFARVSARYDEATLDAIERTVAPLLATSDAPPIVCALYGDEIAATLGYPALGIPAFGGFALAHARFGERVAA